MFGTTPDIPSSDPKGPMFDQLGVAFSTDGASHYGYTESLARASAPDGTLLPDGRAAVYYNDGQTNGIFMSILSGTTLTPVSAVTVNGVFRPRGMADINVALVGGKVRMTWMKGDNPDRNRTFCIAESADGLSFTVLAKAIEFGNSSEADPTVVQLNDGTWLMAYSRQNHTGVGFARSSNGLTFTEYDTKTYGVVPELALTDDGRVRLYVCADGVTSYISSDRGTSWTREAQIITARVTGRNIVCDPTYISAIKQFIFKVTDA